MFNPEINGKIVEFKKKGKPSQEEDKIGSSAVEGTLGATRESVISAERTFENSQEMKAMAHELHALRDEMSDIFEEIKSLTEKAKDKRAKEHQPVKKLKLISKKAFPKARQQTV